MNASRGADPVPDEAGNDWGRFCEAMDNDFNTAQGIGVLFEAVRGINRLLDESAGVPEDALRQALAKPVQDIRRMGGVLGILTELPEDYFEARQSRLRREKGVDAAAVDALVAERTAARKAKDWSRADAIRRQLEAMNVLVEDRPEGTLWKIK